MVTKRKLKSIGKIIRKTRINGSLVRFGMNYARHRIGAFKRHENRRIPYPTTIMLELTNKCNLHCVTCPREYGYGRKMRLGNMDSALARKIVDEVIPYIQSIGLTGMGETLFAPNLLEIARYIKEKKKSVIIAISTNANIPDFTEKISPVLPYIDTVQVSMDGVGDVYENVRHGASFSLFERNVTDLVPLAEGKASVMFNMVITRLNYTDMAAVIRFAAEKGVKFVNFTYFNLASITDVDESYYDFFATDEFQEKLREAKETARQCKGVEVTGLDFPGNPGIRKCPLMWNHFQINYDGEIPPCCAKPFSAEYSFGNVSTEKLIDVVNSPAAMSLRNSWVTGKVNPFCAKCHYLKL